MEWRLNMLRGLWYPFAALGKYTANLVFVLSLLTLISVFLVRLPDSYRCIQLTTGNVSNSDYMGFLDMVSARYQVDRQPDIPLYNVTSPDSKWSILLVKQGSIPNLYTYYLQSTADRSRRVLRESVVGKISPNFFPPSPGVNFSWSPDSQFVVYLWESQDGQTYLSLARIDGMEQQTVPFTRLDSHQVQLSDTFIQEWSGDQHYLSIMEKAVTGFRVSVWNVSNLQRVSSAFDDRILSQGLWLRRENHYAGITLSRSQELEPVQLVLYAPAQAAEIAVIDLPNQVVRLLNVSPDGLHLALTSVIDDCDAKECEKRWQHELFDYNGMRLSSALLGSVLAPTDTRTPALYMGTGIVYSAEQINALWSADSQAWIFLQKGEAGDDLVRLDLTSGQLKPIASNVVTDLFVELLPATRLWRYGFQSFEPIPSLVKADHLLIPTQINDKIRVELLAIASGHRVTLLEGAARLLTKRTDGFGNMVWNWDDTWLVIPWTTAEDLPQTRLTAARTDGSQVDTVALGFKNLASVTWIEQNWIGYLVGEDEAAIEVFNVETHASHQVVDKLINPGYWYVQLVLQTAFATVTLSTNTGDQDIWLVSLDGTVRRHF
jgi:hypothetical protein